MHPPRRPDAHLLSGTAAPAGLRPLPLALIVVAALVAGCDPDAVPDTRGGKVCSVASDCSSGQTCIASRCATAPADAGPTDGGSPDAGPGDAGTPEGHLTLAPSSGSTSAEVSVIPAPVTFKLANDGTDLLHFALSCPGATPAPADGEIAAGASTTVSLAFPAYASPGARTSSCTISTDVTDALLTFTATALISADVTAPTVTLTAPAASAALSGTATLSASAADDVAVASVAFLVDGQVVATVAAAPFTNQWDSSTVANGSHQIAARATDTSGNATVSAAATVTVTNIGHLTHTPSTAQLAVNAGEVPPSVSLTLGNDGTAPLHFAVTCDSGATAAPAAGSLAAATSKVVMISIPTFSMLGTDVVNCSATTADGTGGAEALVITVQVLDDTTPPTVALTAPADGATLTGSATLSATATDASGVAAVDFLLDGAVVATATGAPYAVVWQSASVANGTHSLLARATDIVGNAALTSPVSVQVTNGHLSLSPASVTLTTSAGQPTPGASFTVGNDGLAQLHFALACTGGATATPASGALAATVSSSISVTFPTYLTAGTRTVMCTATSSDGNGGPLAFTATVNVGADVTAPTVSVTGPVASSSVRSTIALTATAADAVGVASVQYFIDGSAVGSSTVGPTWSVSWDSTTVTSAQHTVTAKASDAAGNVGTSAAVTFAVNNSGPTGASISVHTTLGMPDNNFTVDPNNLTHYLSVKHQYVVSYNATLKIPNFSSWELNSTWDTGTADRQNDYRPDDTLPAPISTMQGQLSDYSGSGFQRGHMCPSADRTDTILDNQNTFYLSNMVPQSANNNEGPWADLENYSRTLAMSGMELFIVSGPVFANPNNITRTHGSANGVAIPDSTFKVVVVLGALPAGRTTYAATDVTASTRVIAVVMPNSDSLIAQSDPWTKYCSTARAIEGMTGLNFNADVPQAIQDVIETKLDSSCLAP